MVGGERERERREWRRREEVAYWAQTFPLQFCNMGDFHSRVVLVLVLVIPTPFWEPNKGKGGIRHAQSYPRCLIKGGIRILVILVICCIGWRTSIDCKDLGAITIVYCKHGLWYLYELLFSDTKGRLILVIFSDNEAENISRKVKVRNVL